MSNLFFRDRRLLALAVCLITVAGISSYLILPRMEDPMLTPRAANVTTFLPGADAQRVESLLTEPIENSIEEIQEIKEVRTFSRAGVSLVQIELRDDVYETGAIWARIRDKVDDTRSTLPGDASEPDFDQLDVRAYAMIVSLQWQKDDAPSYAILRRLAEQLEDRMQSLDGTEKTKLFGDPREEIVVSVQPEQISSLGLTSSDIARQLRSSDSKVSAGQLRGSDGGDLLLEVEGELDTLTRISATPVQYGSDGKFVQLGDIASINKGIADPPESMALVDNQPAIAIGVLVRNNTRIDHWASEANEVLDQFESELPRGIKQRVLFEQNDYVEVRLATLRQNLFLGGIAVSIVILFMMGWRSALIVCSALPLAAMMVLTGMRFMDTPIHQMSVTGLIIALGLLIDNAIVIVDEVAQKLREGIRPAEAVSESVRYLALPLFGSTLTTALAFAPIALMPGPAGEFVGSIALNVIIAIASSFLLAMTVIPAFAAIGIRPSDDREAWWRDGFSNRRLTAIYRTGLDFLFRRPALGILLGIVLPIIGFVQGRHLTEQFFPPADRDQFQIELELPAHASLYETREAAEKIRQHVLQHEDVADVHWFLGESAPTFYYNVIPMKKGTPRYAQALVQLKSAEGSRELIHTLQSELDRELPGSLVLVRQLEQGPPFYAPIEFRLFGPDIEQLRDLGDQIRVVMARTPNVIHTRSELAESLPKIKIRVDEEQARLLGLDHRAIAAQLDASLEGAVGGSVLESTEELPVRVRVDRQRRSDLNTIASLDLLPVSMANNGAKNNNSDSNYQGVPLSAISTLHLDAEVGGVTRISGRRMNEVQAFITAGVLPAEVLADIESGLDEAGFQLPPGYSMRLGGESAKRDDAIGNLMASVGILSVLMLATLVLSFKSFRVAGLIVSVAILSVGLGLGSLWLWGFPFGFMAIVGTMGLIGVAINDTIVVLAGIREDEAAREGDPDAIREVVVKSTRHIVATSLTTMAGFTPLILSGGGFWPPMAVAVAGGVGGATILALYYVPSAYMIVMCRSLSNAEEQADSINETDMLTRSA